jgi:acyl dehydratase
MLDRKLIGTESPPRTIEVEKYPLQFFAIAIGESSALHREEAAARSAGFASIVAPPTYAYCLNSMAPRVAPPPASGLNLEKILHGEQSFTYHRPICAGDVLTFRDKVVDIYEKKGGALEFFVSETTVTNQRGERVVDMRTTLVVRN